ncbi:terminase large subunit [soil metagenome]
MHWSTACPDWEQRIVERRSLVPFAPLFQSEADAALEVFKSLHMVGVPRPDGRAGWATFGEACDQFVFDFVSAIFGAYDAKRGTRLITEFLLLISKKNGKSTIAAGIMLTALIRNWRHMAELSILAPTQKVAGNSFKPAAAMVRANPELHDLLKVVAHERLIRNMVTGAELKVIAADANTVGGSQAGFVLIDELWLFGKRASAGDMLEEATGGLASRPEGFVVYLTTHSNEPPAGVFKEKLEYFRDVRDGVIDDPHSFGMLYEWPEKMLQAQAYLKPENFYVTNPSIERSVTVDFIYKKLRKASSGQEEVDEESGETETLQVVLAKYLNVEIGLRLRRDRWAGVDYWERAGVERLRDLDAMLARSEVAVVGIDGGGLDDLTGVCVLGRDRRTKVWLYWNRAFAHRKVLRIRKTIASMLEDFASDGDLVLWGNANLAADVGKMLDDADDAELGEEEVGERGAEPDEDIAAIVAICEHVRDSGLLPENSAIGVDPAAIGSLLDALTDAGFMIAGDDGKGMVSGVSQSAMNMFSAINTMERKLEAGTAAHGGTRLMAWCVSNAKAELRGNAVLITKAAAGKAKIDPLVAAFVATKLMERNPIAFAPVVPQVFLL